MKIYRIEIITNEEGLQEDPKESIDIGEFTIDKQIKLDLRDIKGNKIDIYNRIQNEILKIFFPYENRNNG